MNSAGLLDLPRDISFTTKIFSRASDIPVEEWRRIYPDILESRSFFKTLDESGLSQFEFYYLAVYAGEEKVALAPFFLMRYLLDTTVQGLLKAFLLKIKKIFPRFLELKAVVCGLPMGQGRIGRNEDSGKMMDAIRSGLESFAEEKQISVIGFKDFDQEDCRFLEGLQAQGYYQFENFPSTEMDIPFQSLEEYLKSLSKVSREGFKRKLRKADREGCLEMEIKNRLEPDEMDLVYSLYLQTARKNTELSFEILSRDFFGRISENMPGETRYFLWRKDGRLAAFALCLVSKQRMIDYYLGFDYSIAYDYHLYFVRFRDLMNWCIQNKIQKYEMGPTSYEPKRRLGFGFVRLFIYAKHRNKFANPFFHLLWRLLRPENFEGIFKTVRKNEPARADA